MTRTGILAGMLLLALGTGCKSECEKASEVKCVGWPRDSGNFTDCVHYFNDECESAKKK